MCSDFLILKKGFDAHVVSVPICPPPSPSTHVSSLLTLKRRWSQFQQYLTDWWVGEQEVVVSRIAVVAFGVQLAFLQSRLSNQDLKIQELVHFIISIC